jgi:DNA-damage-inducible protein J
MAANAVVRARIDGKVKSEAELVLASIGLTVSDAFRLMMTRIAREKKMPFEPLVPNKETIEAIEAAQRGEFDWEGPADKLLEHLNADG